MQVEHAIDSGSTPEIQQDNDSEVPTNEQPPHRSIAADRPRRNTQPRKRLIEEVNMASYCLNVAEEIEGIAEPSSYSEAIVSSDKFKWMTAMHDEMESLEKNGTWSLVNYQERRNLFVASGFSKEKKVFLLMMRQGIKHG